YPISVYERGQFALLGAWPAWVLVLLIVLAGGGLAWLIRSRMGEAAPNLRGWRVWTIWGLQAVLAARVVVLLWQAAVTDSQLKPQQNIIAVLVDDSRSMGLSDNDAHGGRSSREDQAIQALQGGVLDSLNKSFQTRLYKVDAAPARIESVKDLQPTA